MKILNKMVQTFSFFILFCCLSVIRVFGYVTNGAGSGGGGLGSGSVGVTSTGWFEDVFVWIIGLAGVVAAAVLIFSAYLYITAGGDEGKIQKATKGITYAVVGLIVAAIAFLIVNFVIDNI